MNKIENILSFWLSCVREQDIQKTELHQDINPHQFISLESDDSFVSNQRDSVKISIDESLHKLLKNQKKSLLLRNNGDSRPIFFFPLIELKGKLSPLFFVDLTDYEKDILSDKGEKSFEINPWSIDTKIGVVTDTFVRMGYDEDHINLDDSIISFIESITGEFTLNFTIAMESLLTYISQDYKTNNKGNELPVFKKGVLKYSDFSESTLVFKKDLLHIIENEKLKHDDVLQDLLFRVETGRKSIPSEYYGTFRSVPMSSGQADVLSIVHQNQEKMIAVQGPPGTGKTFMIMSAIASQITDRAIALANGREFDTKPILATSFTNKAVENIEELISEFYGEQAKHFILLSLGNKDKRISAANKIKETINFLSTANVDTGLYRDIKNVLIDHETLFISEDSSNDNVINKSELDFFSNVFEVKTSNIIDGNDLINVIADKLGVERDLDYVISELKSQQFKLNKLNTNRAVEHHKLKKQYKEYINIIGSDKHIKSALMSADFYTPPISSKKVDVSANRSILSDFIRLIKSYFVKKDLGKVKPKVHDLSEVRSAIQLKRLPPLFSVIKRAREVQKESKELKMRHNLLISSIDKLQALNLAGSDKGDKNFRVKHSGTTHQLFELSLQFIIQHAIANKKEIIPVLKEWSDQINPAKQTKLMNNLSEKLDLIGATYPLITCTLSSISNIIHADDEYLVNNKLFSMSICDESGMVPIYCMPTLILRSFKVLVVGDQKQLSPVIAIDHNRISEFYERYDIADRENLYHPLKASAFQRSAFCKNDSFIETGNSIILDEHRRCVPDISSCFIDIARYNGLVNKTSINEHKELLFQKTFESPLSFIHVKGAESNRRNVNFAEIHRIKKILVSLKASGVDITKQVGIITPFQNQSICLQNELRTLVDHTFTNKKIGTIHAFQGTEFDIIIISLVVFHDKFNVGFIDNKPNILNVAVSRARYRVITVGDIDFLSTLNDGNVSKLIDHSEQTDTDD